MTVRSSPPTRECSALLQDAVPRSGVLSADARVLRCRTVHSRPDWSPPRRRGGAPVWQCRVPSGLRSSLPTRGCPVDDAGTQGGPAALPADAGVFRPRPGAANAIWDPPRRRGGVPFTEGSGLTRQLSSPPTRGCSGALGEPVLVSTYPVSTEQGWPGGPTRGRSQERLHQATRSSAHRDVLPLGVVRPHIRGWGQELAHLDTAAAVGAPLGVGHPRRATDQTVVAEVTRLEGMRELLQRRDDLATPIALLFQALPVVLPQVGI